MQRTMRIAWLAYIVFLSMLLLTSNPARLIGASGHIPGFLRGLMPWAHMLSFLLLAVLTLLARWPLPRWCIVLFLALYGGATEIVQGFVPARESDWMDWLQDLGGLGVGVAVCSIAAFLPDRFAFHAMRIIGRLPLLRGSSVQPAPSLAVTGEPAAMHGGERWMLGQAPFTRFLRVLAGIGILMLPLLMAGDLVRAGSQEFAVLVSRRADTTYAQLLAGLPKRNDPAKLPFNPAEAKQYGPVQRGLGLSGAEDRLLRKNGFVVVHREHGLSFPQAFVNLYRKDLPLFVTTDAVLHAVHRAHDDIVKEMEETSLSSTLRTVLSRCHAELAALAGKPHEAALDDNYRDVDVYLTTALTLLDGKSHASQFNQDDRISELLDALDTLKMPSTMTGPFVELYGGRRPLDASQFKPRGHYTKSETLKRYFRAMMWLGRADTGFNLLPVDPSTKITGDTRRELRDAVLMTDLLVSTGTIKRLSEMDKTVEFLVGQSDNLTPFDFAKLLEKQGVKSLADVATDAAADRLQKAIGDSGLGRQKICSQVMTSPPRPGQAPLPCVFQFFGQRYAIDSFVLSEVVYDAIAFQGQKPMRRVPSGLDVMFALGNDEAASLLAKPLEQYNYAGNLLACRDFVAEQAGPFWQSSAYNLRLEAIRALDDDPPPQANFPHAMRTKAWRLKQLQTQLASWAELRHDNILYAKQSYSRGQEREYPSVYIEPYPKVYASLKRLCEGTVHQIESARFGEAAGGGNLYSRGPVEFLKQMATTLARLESLAAKELKAEPFDATDRAWLKHAVSEHTCDSGDTTYDGWYCKLFYHSTQREMLPWSPIVADVHSAPILYNEGPLPGVAAVLEVGTGGCDMLVVAIDNQNDRGVYVGPVYSYYEFPQPADNRLTDEQWQRMLDSRQAPPPPEWSESFRVKQPSVGRRMDLPPVRPVQRSEEEPSYPPGVD